jgi:hypothetical protein
MIIPETQWPRAAPLSQPAEEVVLKTIKYGFESHKGHQFITDGIVKVNGKVEIS